MIDKYNESLSLTEEEKENKKKSEKLIWEIYKNEYSDQINLIVKAGTAGALETILKEINKIIQNSENISIVDSGIGSFTESEIETAV